ncbi:MAG: hypothetical protein WDM90_14550 [Ferruginibacter sp.]
MALDENIHEELNEIDHDKHVPNQLAALLFKKCNTLFELGKIKGDQLIVSIANCNLY